MENKADPSDIRLGIAAVLAASFLFSSKGVLIKLAFGYDVAPIVLMSLRMLFALPLFALAAVWEGFSNHRGRTDRMTAGDWAALAGLGVLGYYLSSLLDFIGLQYISAGLERILLYLHPSFVIFLSAVFFRRKMERNLLIPLAVCYGGIVLSFYGDFKSGPGNIGLGSLCVILSALCFALFSIWYEDMIRRLGIMRVAAYCMMASCSVIGGHFFLSNSIADLAVPGPVYIIAAVMAVFCTFIPIFLFTYGVKVVGASRSAVLGSIGPVFTLLSAWAFLGEVPSYLQYPGMAMVLVGGVLLGYSGKNRKKDRPASAGNLLQLRKAA